MAGPAVLNVNPVELSRSMERIYKAPDGPVNLFKFVRHGIAPKDSGGKGLSLENFSIYGLALATGVLDPYDPRGSLVANLRKAPTLEGVQVESFLSKEANAGVGTNAFSVITQELIASKVIEAFNHTEGFIGDELVELMPGQRIRNQRIAGMTSLAGPTEVKEGHPYEESGFEEKYVTTREAKKGRILSINEELILFDQTGEIARRARTLGELTRQERERTIVRAVVEADATNEPVYRPSGTPVTLYATDGSRRNYIGSGNTTSSAYNAAVPLVDWTDIQEVFEYRATQVLDDRIDGTPRPIAGINGPNDILLVPWGLNGTAKYILNATQIVHVGSSAQNPMRSTFNNPVAGDFRVMSSPFIDELGGQFLNDWFYGNFRRQFVWTEIWPVQTFMQGADSEAQFERDVVMRVKVRYYGGISAHSTQYVTKVDGA